VCEAETEQELVLREKPADWNACVSIARRKTGPLFAFPAYVSGGDNEALRDTLLEAGYTIGTAYQLADDLLDASGDSEAAGKTLGQDEARNKATAARVALPKDVEPAAYIESLCESAASSLSPWPSVQEAWETYMAYDIGPAIRKILGAGCRRGPLLK
jgi:geranylgeranyl pyrophosphate synthase